MLFLHPPEDVGDVRSSAERLNQLGIDTALFEPDRFVKEYPSFSRDGIGVAALERGAGYADSSTRRPKGCSAGPSSSVRWAGWVSRSCVWSRRRRACR